VWTAVVRAAPEAIEEAILTLEQGECLTDEVITMEGERGGIVFFERALARRAALPVEQVRSMHSMHRTSEFVQLVRLAQVNDNFGPRLLRVARRHFPAAEQQSSDQAFEQTSEQAACGAAQQAFAPVAVAC
jgi:hypothetical protein